MRPHDLLDWPRVRRAAGERLQRARRSTRGAALARAHRQSWAEAAASGRPPVEVFAGVGDDDWLWLNTTGLRREQALRDLLPALPAVEVQRHYTGSAGDVTLREGWNVYRLIRQCHDQHAPDQLSPGSRVLEFGCGWGRITRFFAKDLQPSGLVGIDCDAAMIEHCRTSNGWCDFAVVDVLPPTGLPSETFDLVYAYSVFSHLSEAAHEAWLDEFRRVLRPGGLLVVSTRARSFIELCAWLRTDHAAAAPASHLVSAGAFLDTETALSRYDQGHYAFSYRSEADPPHFGEACISSAYVHANWTGRFQVLDYLDDRARCEQNVIVARKS